MKKETSIIIGIKGDKILLGMKKRGHGMGFWNGFGGKKETGETIMDAAIREIKEEAGIVPSDLRKIGMIDFPLFITTVFVFSEYSGEVIETEEMKPKWFLKDKLPYDKMWEGDKMWFHLVFSNKKFSARFRYDGNQMKEFHLKIND